MANDALDLLLRANFALAAAILVVLALRRPVRAWFGARVAYALWLMPPLAALLCFAPPRRVEIALADLPAPAPAADFGALIAAAPADGPSFSTILIAVWMAGALLSLIVLAARQHRFLQALGRLMPRAELGAGVFGAETAAAGPAVVGVLRPRIVTPADFDTRFDAAERDVVMAHERAHLAQRDPLINAAVALARCCNWFNPFVYLAERALRFDQELSCDAAVLGAHCGARRRYAGAMLKSHARMLELPLGCAWPSGKFQPMKERITMLKQALPSRARRILGASVVALTIGAVGFAAWSARPVDVSAKAGEARSADAAPEREHAVHGEDAVHWNADVDVDVDAQALLGGEGGDFDVDVAEWDQRSEASLEHYSERLAEYQARAAAFEAEAAQFAELQAMAEPPEPPEIPEFAEPPEAPLPEEIAQLRAEARRAALRSHGAQVAMARSQLEAQMAQMRQAQAQLNQQEQELARARAELDQQMAQLRAAHERLRARNEALRADEHP
jgi:beta-lactamase regulating signal transducer with metallopeptidase domain